MATPSRRVPSVGHAPGAASGGRAFCSPHRIYANMLFLVAALYPLTLALFYAATTLHPVGAEDLGWLRLAILLLFLPILGKYLVHLAIAPWYGLAERRRARRAAAPFCPPTAVPLGRQRRAHECGQGRLLHLGR